MLVELSVRNLAIFEDVRVPFAPGLNIVTGETGAGKSILVEAIRLALGEKADPMSVRAGEEEAEVSALFDLSGREDLKDDFEEAGLSWEEELVLRRVIPSSGRSRAYLNGRMVAQPVFGAIAPRLVELVGQHSVHALLSKNAALAAVDACGGTGGDALAMRREYRAVSALRRRLEEVAARAAAARERKESLDFRIGELSGAALHPGEEESLAAELAVLRNEGKVREALRGAEEALSSSEHAADASLSFAVARLREVGAIDARFAEMSDRLGNLRAEIREIASDLARQAGRLSAEAGRRDEIEERITLIRRLKRKYDLDVAGLIGHFDVLRAERASLDGLLGEEEALRARLRKEEEEALRAAASLSAGRTGAARRMSAAVEKELARVDLPNARFRAVVESRGAAPENLSASGLDEADLLFCANPGQEMRPLAQVASGGELSRVMLALRNVSARGGGRRTMVFDEIDTGIGGKVAERVGARLRALSASAQVVCVTHLPQVAAFAGSHLAVIKRVSGETVATVVKPLSKQDRIDELARMISGTEITGQARAHARELIEKAVKG